MKISAFLKRFYFQIIVAISALAVVFAIPSSEKMGDRLQIAIPIIGLACSFEMKDAGEYAGRFLLGLGTVHAIKNSLPDSGINLRPNGSGNGFPSGHTYAATYSASYIVRNCAERVPYLGPAVSLGAAFVGISRVSSKKHNIWQVISGAFFGIAFDIGFRNKKNRQRIRTAFLNGINRLKFMFRSAPPTD